MSKITFRADDDLVEAIESFEASKSEVMREALREYLQSHPDVDLDGTASATGSQTDIQNGTIDEVIVDRVDELVTTRLDDLLGERRGLEPVRQPRPPQDVNVNVTVDGVSDTAEGVPASEQTPEPASDSEAESDAHTQGSADRKTQSTDGRTDPDGSKQACGQCGERLGADHVYCPNCGEKATRRLFCDCGDELRSDWAFCPGCGRRTPAADVLDPS